MVVDPADLEVPESLESDNDDNDDNAGNETKKKKSQRGKSGCFTRHDKSKTTPKVMLDALPFLDCYKYFTTMNVVFAGLMKLVGMEEINAWKSSTCTGVVSYEDMKLGELPAAMTVEKKPLQADIDKFNTMKAECHHDDVELLERIITKELSLSCLLAYLCFREKLTNGLIAAYCESCSTTDKALSAPYNIKLRDVTFFKLPSSTIANFKSKKCHDSKKKKDLYWLEYIKAKIYTHCNDVVKIAATLPTLTTLPTATTNTTATSPTIPIPIRLNRDYPPSLPSRFSSRIPIGLKDTLSDMTQVEAVTHALFNTTLKETTPMAYLTNFQELLGSAASTSDPLRSSGFLTTNISKADFMAFHNYATPDIMKKAVKVVAAYIEQGNVCALACPASFRASLEGPEGQGHRRGKENGMLQSSTTTAYSGHLAKLVVFLVFNNRLALSFDESDIDKDKDRLHLALIEFSTSRNATLAEEFVKYAALTVDKNGAIVIAGVDYLGHLASAIIWGLKLVWSLAHYVMMSIHEGLRGTMEDFLNEPTGNDDKSVSLRHILRGDFNKSLTVVTFLSLRSFATSHIGHSPVNDIFHPNEHQIERGNYGGDINGTTVSCESTGVMFKKSLEMLDALGLKVFGTIPDFADLLSGKVKVTGVEGQKGDSCSFWFINKEGMPIMSSEL